LPVLHPITTIVIPVFLVLVALILSVTAIIVRITSEITPVFIIIISLVPPIGAMSSPPPPPYRGAVANSHTPPPVRGIANRNTPGNGPGIVNGAIPVRVVIACTIDHGPPIHITAIVARVVADIHNLGSVIIHMDIGDVVCGRTWRNSIYFLWDIHCDSPWAGRRIRNIPDSILA
jgi:hypothetical protein